MPLILSSVLAGPLRWIDPVAVGMFGRSGGGRQDEEENAEKALVPALCA